MTKQGKRKWVLPLACYALAVLVFLGVRGGALAAASARARRGQLAPQELPLAGLELENIIPIEREDFYGFVSTNSDPQIIYRPAAPFYASSFTFGATSNWPGGEMCLYYCTREGQEFSEQRKLYAKQDAAGTWYFDLGGRRYTALRFDPEIKGGVLWEVDSMALNARAPSAAWLLPGPAGVFVLLFAPGLAAALLCEAAALLAPAFAGLQKRRNGKSKDKGG